MKIIKKIMLIKIFSLVFFLIAGCHQNSSIKAEQNYSNIFLLNLYSDKQVYKLTDKIKIWATLKYIGENEDLKIWHVEPYISFYISDGKEFNIGGIVNTIITSNTLHKGRTYKFEYVKNGGYNSNKKDIDYWKKFYKEKELYLPKGTYTINVSGVFSVNENLNKGKVNLIKEKKIIVK